MLWHEGRARLPYGALARPVVTKGAAPLVVFVTLSAMIACLICALQFGIDDASACRTGKTMISDMNK
jgi:hypothetical protein